MNDSLLSVAQELFGNLRPDEEEDWPQRRDPHVLSEETESEEEDNQRLVEEDEEEEKEKEKLEMIEADDEDDERLRRWGTRFDGQEGKSVFLQKEPK